MDASTSDVGSVSYPEGWVKLNVGGRIIATTLETLCMDKQSVLARLFQAQLDEYQQHLRRASTAEIVTSPALSKMNSLLMRDSSGAVLLDREYRYFSPIVNFLRTGVLVVDPSVSPEGILNEAEFWQIEGVVSALRAQLPPDLTRSDVIKFRSQISSFAGLHLPKINLSGLVFEGESFEGSSMAGATLDNAVFDSARFSQTDLTGSTMIATSFKRAVMLGLTAPGSKFDEANLEYANLRDAELEGSTFLGTEATGTVFQHAWLVNCTFDGATLTQCKFQNCNLQGSDFSCANLTDCRFITADIRGTIFDWGALASSHLGGSFHTPFERARVTQEEYDAIDLPDDVKARFRLLVVSPDTPFGVIPISYSDSDSEAGDEPEGAGGGDGGAV